MHHTINKIGRGTGIRVRKQEREKGKLVTIGRRGVDCGRRQEKGWEQECGVMTASPVTTSHPVLNFADTHLVWHRILLHFSLMSLSHLTLKHPKSDIRWDDRHNSWQRKSLNHYNSFTRSEHVIRGQEHDSRLAVLVRRHK